jgi:hypothetical protein
VIKSGSLLWSEELARQGNNLRTPAYIEVAEKGRITASSRNPQSLIDLGNSGGLGRNEFLSS